LSHELQELLEVSQVSWKMLLGLFTLLLVQFGTLVNPVTIIIIIIIITTT